MIGVWVMGEGRYTKRGTGRNAHNSMDIGAEDATAEDIERVANVADCVTRHGLERRWQIHCTAMDGIQEG